MKNSKFMLFGLVMAICMSICCAFAGCLSTADYEAIYNDDAKIINGSVNRRVASTSLNSTSAYGGSYKLTCKSLSGVCELKREFTVTESTSAQLSLDVTDGKFKVVLTGSDTVYTLAEGSFDGELNFNSVPYGTYKLKIVGVDAQIKLTLEYTF